MDKQQLEKIEAEPDQWRRMITMVQYIIENGSTEVKNQVEDAMRAALAVGQEKEPVQSIHAGKSVSEILEEI